METGAHLDLPHERLEYTNPFLLHIKSKKTFRSSPVYPTWIMRKDFQMDYDVTVYFSNQNLH